MILLRVPKYEPSLVPSTQLQAVLREGVMTASD